MNASVVAAPRPEWALFGPVLARLEADAAAHFGTPRVRLVPAGYEERPFSHVLRVGVCRQEARPQQHLFVKLFKPKPLDGGIEKMRGRVVHDFERTRRIAAAMAHWNGLGVVRPVACYPEHLAIVTEEADGVTLLAHLEAQARWFPSSRTVAALEETLGSVGRWVKAFQTIERRPGQVSLADVRAYIDLRLERLETHRVIATAARAQVLAHLDALAGLVPPADLTEVIVHADLAPGNILVAGRRVVVLDFAMVQRGTPLHDLTRLYLQLDVLRTKPQFRAAVIRALQAALLRGYDPGLRPDRPLFRYLLMLHRVNHFGTLSLSRERFPARALSARVRRLHWAWMEQELRTGASVGGDS